MTELADTLVRSENISFRQSHKIVSLCVRELVGNNEESLASLTWDLANEKSKEITGKALKINEIAFYQALQPEYFVNIRTLKGGPAPATMRKSLVQAQDDSVQFESWLREKTETILQAEDQLEHILKGGQYMTNQYVLAVDGGATKTVMTIRSTDGRELFSATSTSSNYQAVGIEHVRHVFTGLLRSAAAHLPSLFIDVAVFAISGVDTAQDKKVVNEIIHESIARCPFTFGQIIIENDVEATLKV